MNMQATMDTRRTADAEKRLSARPAAFTGLSRKSPPTAPSGRVRINAAQKRMVRYVRDIVVR
jgi:hypothetical protein